MVESLAEIFSINVFLYFHFNGKSTASYNLIELDSNKFALEKEIQTLVEKNTQELFALDLIKSEYIIGDFRFDSLCFDNESKSFVIIEYKNTENKSVIDQGYAYLSTMLEKKSDFILEKPQDLLSILN